MRRALLSILAGFALAGCYENPDVILHDPHAYQGRVDGHTGDAGYRREQLRLRFKTVQTDR
jgi:hypothetical protein